MKLSKRSIFLILTFVFLFLGCDKSDSKTTPEFESTALITGEDFALCPCCGGWFITISGEQTTYRFDQLPPNSNINLSTATFPLAVKMNWSLLVSQCSNMPRIAIESVVLN